MNCPYKQNGKCKFHINLGINHQIDDSSCRHCLFVQQMGYSAEKSSAQFIRHHIQEMKVLAKTISGEAVEDLARNYAKLVILMEPKDSIDARFTEFLVEFASHSSGDTELLEKVYDIFGRAKEA